MILKLLKYDFKYYINKLSLLYIGSIILSLIAFFTSYFNNDVINLIYRYALNNNNKIIENGLEDPGTSFIVALLIIIMTVVVFVLAFINLLYVEKRFKTSVLGEEAYLTMTLPVKTESIIASKLISGTILIIFNFIFTLIIAVIATGGLIIKNIGVLDINSDIIRPVARFSLIIILLWILVQAALYFISAFTSLPMFGKRKKIFEGIMAILMIVGYIKLADIITGYIFFNGIGNIINIILTILFFFGTNYIVKNKLNVE